jgi:hypothetical protein
LLCYRASLAKIPGGIAYPVEPFGFEMVPGDPLPLLLEGNNDRLGKEQDLCDEVNDGLVNKFQDYSFVICSMRRAGRPAYVLLLTICLGFTSGWLSHAPAGFEPAFQVPLDEELLWFLRHDPGALDAPRQFRTQFHMFIYSRFIAD